MRTSRKNWLLPLLVGSLLINGGLGVTWIWKILFSSQGQGTLQQKGMRKPPLVKIALAKKEAITLKKTFPGVLRASEAVDIIADVQGRVRDIFVTIGSRVKKGDVLIQLDDRSAQAEVEGAKAKAEHSKNLYLSFQKLSGIRSQVEINEKKAAWQMAESELTKARLIVGHHTIKAPFDGVIGNISVSKGAMIDPRQVVTRLVNVDKMWIYFDVTEADAARLSPKQEIDVSIPDLQALPETGEIIGVQPYSDEASHAVRIQAQLPNPDRKFRDGAYAKITVPVSSDENAIVVPRDAILVEGKQHFVYVIRDIKKLQKVTKVAVIIGMKEEDRVQIVDGLSSGDVVVTDPVDMLVDNLPVRIENATPSTTETEPPQV